MLPSLQTSPLQVSPQPALQNHSILHLSPKTQLCLPADLLNDSSFNILSDSTTPHPGSSPVAKPLDSLLCRADSEVLLLDDSTCLDSSFEPEHGIQLVTKCGAKLIVRDPALMERLLLTPLRKALVTALNRWLNFADEKSLLRLDRLRFMFDRIWTELSSNSASNVSQQGSWLDYVLKSIVDTQKQQQARECLLMLQEINENIYNPISSLKTPKQSVDLTGNNKNNNNSINGITADMAQISMRLGTPKEKQTGLNKVTVNKDESFDDWKTQYDKIRQSVGCRSENDKNNGDNIIAIGDANYDNDNKDNNNDDDDDDDGVEVDVGDVSLIGPYSVNMTPGSRQRVFGGGNSGGSSQSLPNKKLQTVAKTTNASVVWPTVHSNVVSSLQLTEDKARAKAKAKAEVLSQLGPAEMTRARRSRENSGASNSTSGFSNSKPMQVHSGKDRPTKEDAAFNIRYKTQPCLHYERSSNGYCPAGSNCHFAHGPAELRTPQIHPKFKTKVCNHFAETLGIWCPFGETCFFSHDIADVNRYHKQKQTTNSLLAVVEGTEVIDSKGEIGELSKNGRRRRNRLRNRNKILKN